MAYSALPVPPHAAKRGCLSGKQSSCGTVYSSAPMPMPRVEPLVLAPVHLSQRDAQD